MCKLHFVTETENCYDDNHKLEFEFAIRPWRPYCYFHKPKDKLNLIK